MEFVAFLFSALGSNVGERCDVLRGQHRVGRETLSRPGTQRFYDFVFGERHVERFAEKGKRVHFGLFGGCFVSGRGKESPATVEADIDCELLVVFVGGHDSSVDADNFTDPLTDGQVVELVGEEDHAHVP